jgi:hypothetical protein
VYELQVALCRGSKVLWAVWEPIVYNRQPRGDACGIRVPSLFGSAAGELAFLRTLRAKFRFGGGDRRFSAGGFCLDAFSKSAAASRKDLPEVRRRLPRAYSLLRAVRHHAALKTRK